MLIVVRYLLLACFVFLLGGCLVGPSGTSGRVVVQGDHGSVDISFSDYDRDLLRDHYQYKQKSKYKKLPPGLAKKNKLPPGIQKQLVRNSQLPPGLTYQRLPSELERRMSHLPDGYLRVMIDGNFVLFNEQSKVIFDIIREL